MAAPRKYPEELRERAVRLVFESKRPIAHVAQDMRRGKKRRTTIPDEAALERARDLPADNHPAVAAVEYEMIQLQERQHQNLSAS